MCENEGRDPRKRISSPFQKVTVWSGRATGRTEVIEKNKYSKNIEHCQFSESVFLFEEKRMEKRILRGFGADNE